MGCKGTTKQGKPCKAAPLKGTERCLAHSDADTRGSVGFTAEAGHLGGRPRKPRADEIVRERIEAELDVWLDVLTGAREATYQRMIGYGESATVVEEDDHRTRLRAFAAAFDRAFGRPRQVLEHSGDPDAPILVEQALDLRKLSDEDLAQLEAIRARAAE